MLHLTFRNRPHAGLREKHAIVRRFARRVAPIGREKLSHADHREHGEGDQHNGGACEGGSNAPAPHVAETNGKSHIGQGTARTLHRFDTLSFLHKALEARIETRTQDDYDEYGQAQHDKREQHHHRRRRQAEGRMQHCQTQRRDRKDSHERRGLCSNICPGR